MPLRCAASSASRICPAYSTALLERQRPLQRRALDELHHQVIRPDVVELADVRMIQRRHGARFALEAFGELLLGDLDGDDAVEPRVARLPHLAHAARADGARISYGPSRSPGVIALPLPSSTAPAS